jgi:single-strand DNA-binding protein
MVIGKLIQRSFETEGQKRTAVEIQVQHVGPDLQFATAQVEKVTGEKQSA